MSDTDNPLKLLITDFADAFAAWLLPHPVQWIRPLNVEFPATPLRSDLLFEAMGQDDQPHLLHYELQGRSSRKQMPFRELEYMSQVIIREIPLPLGPNSPRLHSVVLYIGEGAGRGDKGNYTVYGADGVVTLHWRYHPIRLWEMTPATLLQLEQPALSALIGLTRLQQPAQELPQALSRIRQVADSDQRQRLLTAMVSLLPTEEVTKMVETLLESSETLLLDTPFLRRMREKGREEGVQIGLERGQQIGLERGQQIGLEKGQQIGLQKGQQIGREEGVQIGLEKGQQIGLQKGQQIGREEGVQIGREAGLRDAILEAVARRFNPPATDYRELQRRLETIHQPDQLQQVLLALFEAQNTAVILDLLHTLPNNPA